MLDLRALCFVDTETISGSGTGSSVVFRRPMEHNSTFHVVSQHVPVPRRAATAPFEGYFERTCETGDWRDGGERTSEALHNIRLGVDIYVVNEEKRSTRRANGSV